MEVQCLSCQYPGVFIEVDFLNHQHLGVFIEVDGVRASIHSLFECGIACCPGDGVK